MPVSIVVGGQFGSEGKGKVALELRRRSSLPVVVIRVGGPNSGHTGYDQFGKKWALRQLPAGAIDRDVDVIFPPGSYIDPLILQFELDKLQYPQERVHVSPFASVITPQHRQWERDSGLVGEIGSTGSGVGAAVLARSARGTASLGLQHVVAQEFTPLHPFLKDTTELVRQRLEAGARVIVEGTQGFGLSLLDGGYWPKATGRTTTAAGALAEAGLSPLDVDDVTLVLRTFPIRVAGDSGPLLGETTWRQIGLQAGLSRDLTEYTTVTNKVRRVGTFDPLLVARAIAANRPTRIVINHLDYLGDLSTLEGTQKARAFLSRVETEIGHSISWVGTSPTDIFDREKVS